MDKLEIINNLPGMVYRCVNDSPKLPFTYVSDGCKLLTGYAPDEFTSENGLKLMDLVHPSDSDMINRLHEVTLFAGVPLETTFRIMTKEGEEKWVWVRSRVIETDSGGMPYVFEGFYTDVTKHLRVEISKMANRAKSDFLGRMSHEIRTPMNAIIGMAEIGLREDMPETVRNHTHTIKQAGGKLMAVLNDIIDFTSIESGELELFMEDYGFAAMISDVIGITKAQADEANLSLMVYISNKIPSILHGDVIRVRQILLSLLSNAVKFTDEGYVDMSIEGEVVGDSVNLTITIEDTGRGIKEEDIDSIFEEFTQFDIKTIEGSGLGLAITRNLVDLMDGEIQVSSMPTVGSIFTVTLPQTISNHESLCSVEFPESQKVLIFENVDYHVASIIRTLDGLGVAHKSVQTNSEFHDALSTNEYSYVFARKELYEAFTEENPLFQTDASVVLNTMPMFCLPVADILNGSDTDDYRFITSENQRSYAKIIAPDARVLIVDDIETNLKVAEGLLLPYKMQINLCASGLAAMEAVKLNYYDLILMDHMMPVMDGVEATLAIRKLKNCRTDCRNVPIVALTANAVYGTREMFLKNGFDDFIPKPIDTFRLNGIIEKWIPKSKQSEATELFVIGNTSAAQPDFEIDGVDVKKGLEMTGGDMDIYLDVLQSYYESGRKLFEEIQRCIKQRDMELYRIHVHAIKSTSGSIGAAEFATFAESLELACEKKDIDFVDSNNPKFMVEFEMLLDNIYPVVMNGLESKSVDMDVLKPELSLLKLALVRYDIVAINEFSKNLQEYLLAPGVGDVINKILQNKMIGEYEEAVKLIDTLLEG